MPGTVPGDGPCRIDTATPSPSGVGHPIRCDVLQDPAGGHAGGLVSEPFPIDPQGFYYVEAMVKANGTGSAAGLVMGGVNESSANWGAALHATAGGGWVRVGGTFVSPIDSVCSSDCYADIYTRFVGSGTLTW